MNKLLKKSFYLERKVVADVYYKIDAEKELFIFSGISNEYERLISFFNVIPEKIKIKLLYTREEMNLCWGEESRVSAMVDNNDPFLIYIFSPIIWEEITPYKLTMINEIITHEIAHTFVTQLNKRCFSWMNEGISELASLGNEYQEYNTINKIDWQWFKKENVLVDPNLSWSVVMDHDGYSIAYNLVKYIVNNLGKEKMVKLLKIRRINSKNLVSKINSILGKDYNLFLLDFEKSVKFN